MTNAESVTFTAAIREVADQLGREASLQRVSALNAVLQSLGRITDENTVVVELDGEHRPIDEYLAEEISKFPLAAPEIETGKPVAGVTANGFIRFQVGSSTSLRRADDPMVRITQALEAKQIAETAKVVASWPNPWLTGSNYNRTRQQVIINTNPALAAKFKAESHA